MLFTPFAHISRRGRNWTPPLFPIISVGKRNFHIHGIRQCKEKSRLADKRREILENALAHVGSMGWTYEALAVGAQQAGLPSTAHGIISNGPVDLVYYFIDNSNLRMINEMPSLNGMTLKEKIMTLVQLRLSFIIPYLSRWPEAMALLAQPQNLFVSLQKLAELIDEIWYQAGDKTTDHNWYIQRTLLTAVYTSTELHLLTDASENQIASWLFLERRIQDMACAAKTQSDVEQVLAYVGNIAMSFLEVKEREKRRSEVVLKEEV